MAHWLNLIGDALAKTPALNVELQKLLKLINIISHNKPLANKLRELGANRLHHSVPTRWYSTCESINSFLGIKQKLEQVPSQRKFENDK